MTIEWNGQEFVRTTRVPIEEMGAPNDPRPEVPETTSTERALLDRIGELEKELEGVREQVKMSEAGWSAANAEVVEVRKELEEANAEVIEVMKEKRNLRQQLAACKKF